MSLEPNYAINNNCEPCQLRQGLMKNMAETLEHSQFRSNPQAQARIVSPHPEINTYSSHIGNIVKNINAINLGKLSDSNPQATFAGYTSRMSKY